MADPKPDDPTESLAPEAPATPPTPPPAARIVVEGTKTEREVALELEKKNLEIRVAHLEDEKRRLKELPAPDQLGTPPAPEKKSWLAGATFFD